tara:strand:+ start:1637 stop:2089 length:453 start_codon:yes stop_codon:yes gene_type:complete
MPNLNERVTSDLTDALKKKETLRLDTIRLLKTDIMKFEMSGKTRKEAKDDDIISLISRMIKQRHEATELFRKGNREEMAKKEEAEIKILQDYLPPQLSNEELEKIVKETISQLGANNKSAMGKVMGAMMGKVKGKADGAAVKSVVMKMLP